jgi:thiol:disulfide interchange protein
LGLSSKKEFVTETPKSDSVSIWVLLGQLAVLILIFAGGWAVLNYFQQPKAISNNPISSDSISGDSVQWLSIQDGEKVFKKGKKPILYDFTATWCHFCKKMNAEVFQDKTQAAFINQSFVPITVMDQRTNTTPNPPEVTDLQSRYKIGGFPTLVVRYPDNTFKVNVGYLGSEGIIQFLQSAAKPN